jgi:hypothetical protein
LLIPDQFITFRASREESIEAVRWYTDGGARAVVLSTRGALLEPHPTFGPREYRLLAINVNLEEASDYAYRRGFMHMRELRPRDEIHR